MWFVNSAAIYHVAESLDYRFIYSDLYRHMEQMASKDLHSSVVKQAYATYGEGSVQEMLVEVVTGVVKSRKARQRDEKIVLLTGRLLLT